MPRIPTLYLFLLPLVTSCATQPPRPVELNDLAGTWQLVGEVPVGARIPTLTIRRDGRVGGTAGVNRYQTALTIDNATKGSFRVTPPASTRMTGTQDAMQLEDAFLDALGGADNAVIEGEQLVIRWKTRVLLRFDRVTRG